MKIQQKAEEILGRLAPELDALGVEYMICYGIRNETESFGKMALSDKFSVSRAIEAMEVAIKGLETLRDELEHDLAGTIATGIEKAKRQIN